MAEQSLKKKTARNILWGLINNGGQQVLNLVFGIFLARLLSPSDYGMVGMLTIFSLIAGALQESGFISALNRKAQVTKSDYDAVFWFSILCSFTIYALLFACAPLIATWFNQPALVPLSRFSFLSFVVSAFGTTPRAYLFRNLRVKQMTGISLVALFVSGVTGIVLAWQGFAYWGIAIQSFVFCSMIAVLNWYVSGYRPSLRIDFHPLRSMIGFSSKLLVTNIFSIINNNIFSVFFGRLYGERMVGYYNQANKWTTIGYTFLNSTFGNVTQPIFARLTDDRKRQCRAFRKMLRFTAFLSCPALFGLALIAPELITILITDKWIESAQLMQLLCIGGAFLPITSFYSNYLVSQGRSNVFLWNTVGLCLLQTVALIGLHPFGVHVMVIAYVVLGILWIPMWHRYVRRLIGMSLWQAICDVSPFALCAAATMGIAWAAALPMENIYARITTKIVVAVLVYVGAMRLLHVVIFRESVDFLLSRFRHKA